MIPESALEQEIHTERLVLRPLALTDAPRLYILRSDPSINTYLDRVPDENMEATRSFIEKIQHNEKEKLSFYRVICLKEDPSLIGTICLWNFNADQSEAETGFELMTTWQGKGLMGEALQALLNFGFTQLSLNKIIAQVHKNNQDSLRLLKRNAFSPDPAEPEEEQLVLWSITNNR